VLRGADLGPHSVVLDRAVAQIELGALPDKDGGVEGVRFSFGVLDADLVLVLLVTSGDLPSEFLEDLKV